MAWASRDIFHEFAVDYAKKVEEMTGGRLKFDVLLSRCRMPGRNLDGGHGVCYIWYSKHKAASMPTLCAAKVSDLCTVSAMPGVSALSAAAMAGAVSAFGVAERAVKAGDV